MCLTNAGLHYFWSVYFIIKEIAPKCDKNLRLAYILPNIISIEASLKLSLYARHSSQLAQPIHVFAFDLGHYNENNYIESRPIMVSVPLHVDQLPSININVLRWLF